MGVLKLKGNILRYLCLALFVPAFLFTPVFEFVHLVNAQINLNTEIEVTICGNGEVETVNEECDYGDGNNVGGYSTTITGRQCNPDCTWAPYCGDDIVQTVNNEECDDGNNEPDDFCTAECKRVSVVGPSGPTGSGNNTPGSSTPPGNTQVKIVGKAYPHSNVNILKDGTVIGVVAADAKADFSFTSAGITPGTTTFGIWAEDRLGLRSIALTVTFEVVQGSTTTVSGVFLPPTLDLDRTEVNRGDIINMTGSTVPEVQVSTEVNSEHTILDSTISSETGEWELDFDTSPLEEGAHTARAMFEIEDAGLASESSFSQAVSFFVGQGQATIGTADLNLDDRVNLIDFSILLFHWNTDGGDSDPPADINRGGRVDLADFSIMLFNWTG
ncbi:MAG: DUF4215 domain-containing protein [Candidatus Spechtbacterales bacterium]|nr:DUF4215 domain-containing protein [Candidatus Spechtbacterales bacterium]